MHIKISMLLRLDGFENFKRNIEHKLWFKNMTHFRCKYFNCLVNFTAESGKRDFLQSAKKCK